MVRESAKRQHRQRRWLWLGFPRGMLSRATPSNPEPLTQESGKDKGKDYGIYHGLSREPGVTLNGSCRGLYFAHVSHETISPLRHGLDIQHRTAVITKLLSKSEDILRQRGLFDEGIRPDLL